MFFKNKTSLGFTLPELIIAVFIVTILLGGATTYFLNFINDQVQSIGYLEAMEENMLELNYISDTIKSAEDVSVVYPPEDPRPESLFHKLIVKNPRSDIDGGPYSLLGTTEIDDPKVPGKKRQVMSVKDFVVYNGIAYAPNSKTLYYADTGNHVIRSVVLATGEINIVAGQLGQAGMNDQEEGISASDAFFSSPSGIAVDTSGNLYISDTQNHRIRKINTNGLIETIAGNGNQGFEESNQTPATETPLNQPMGVHVDGNGNVFFADSRNHRVRKITNGNIQTVAGKGYSETYEAAGNDALNLSLSYPIDITLDDLGNIYITDSYNSRIVRVDVGSGNFRTLAGSQLRDFSGDDGFAPFALMNIPTGIHFANGKLYVSDSLNHVIREIDTGRNNVLGDNDDRIRSIVGYTARLFIHPGRDKVSPEDDIYQSTIRPKSGFLQGRTGVKGEARSPLVRINNPSGLATDEFGNVLFADSLNNQIRFLVQFEQTTNIKAIGDETLEKNFVYSLVQNPPLEAIIDGTKPNFTSIDFDNFLYNDIGDFVGKTEMTRFRFEKNSNYLDHPSVQLDIEAAYIDPRDISSVQSRLQTTVGLRNYQN